MQELDVWDVGNQKMEYLVPVGMFVFALTAVKEFVVVRFVKRQFWTQ
jgi:hypothetical protein